MKNKALHGIGVTIPINLLESFIHFLELALYQIPNDGLLAHEEQAVKEWAEYLVEHYNEGAKEGKLIL